MRAVILAAGESRRLFEYTREIPKCLLDVGGRSILERQISSLREAGIEEITVVVGHGADALRRVGGPSLRYVTNPDYRTTNSIWVTLISIVASSRGENATRYTSCRLNVPHSPYVGEDKTAV